jgi:pyrimidine-specific ribonucleoside hydrolase
VTVGETRDDDESPREAAEALAGHAERYADLGFGDLVERLRSAGRFPASTAGTPLVLDTDIGGDPDDAVAVSVAALNRPELALVVTTDEHKGRRARFARHLLDLCGRTDVAVLAGADLGNTRYLVTEGLTPDDVPEQPTGLDGLAAACRDTPSVVRWVGMGPMTNLAALLEREPSLADKLDVTLMGGALAYRHPDRAEHNVRLDVPSARAVLATARRPRLVTSDVTFTGANEITADSPLHQRLAAPDAPGWARLLTAHMRAWFERFHPGTMQHDALALSVALQLPFVDLGLERVALDGIGRMHEAPEGDEVFLSYGADYGAFDAWLSAQLLSHLSGSPA